MQRKQNTILTLVLAAAFAGGLATAHAADNPFAAARGAGSYAVAAADEAMKCGAGKCGAAMMGDSQKAEPGKTSTEKATTGKTSTEKAATGKTKAKAKSKAKTTEAKCGAGKCGAAMGMTEQDKAKMSKSAADKCAGAAK